MPYNDSDSVIAICGIKPKATDDVDNFITIADRTVIERITIKVTDEIPYGTIDGSNKLFTLRNYPLADTNADSAVKGYQTSICTSALADLHAYVWTAQPTVISYPYAYPNTAVPRDLSLRTEVEIDNARSDFSKGNIWLVNAPSANTYSTITVSYSFYPNPLDFTLLKLEAALYAGYLFLLGKYSLYPKRLKLGSFSVDFSKDEVRGGGGGSTGGLPYERILQEFDRNWSRVILKNPIRKIIRPEERWTSYHTAAELYVDRAQDKAVYTVDQSYWDAGG
jgi:hypothetical protein